MRKIAYTASVLVFSYLCFISLQCLKDINGIRRQNKTLEEEVSKLTIDLNKLEELPSSPLSSTDNNYSNLTKTISAFSRFSNMKTLLQITDLGKEKLVSKSVGSTSWPGIEKISLNVFFYDLKEAEEFIKAFIFLEKLENNFSLKISNIVQKDNLLKVDIQLYGRQL